MGESLTEEAALIRDELEGMEEEMLDEGCEKDCEEEAAWALPIDDPVELIDKLLICWDPKECWREALEEDAELLNAWNDEELINKKS